MSENTQAVRKLWSKGFLLAMKTEVASRPNDRLAVSEMLGDFLNFLALPDEELLKEINEGTNIAKARQMVIDRSTPT